MAVARARGAGRECTGAMLGQMDTLPFRPNFSPGQPHSPASSSHVGSRSTCTVPKQSDCAFHLAGGARPKRAARLVRPPASSSKQHLPMHRSKRAAGPCASLWHRTGQAPLRPGRVLHAAPQYLLRLLPLSLRPLFPLTLVIRCGSLTPAGTPGPLTKKGTRRSSSYGLLFSNCGTSRTAGTARSAWAQAPHIPPEQCLY